MHDDPLKPSGDLCDPSWEPSDEELTILASSAGETARAREEARLKQHKEKMSSLLFDEHQIVLNDSPRNR